MMHRLRRAPTAEDRRVVRNWTRGVLIVYGAFALIVFGLASLSQHSADGSKDAAARALTTVAADTESLIAQVGVRPEPPAESRFLTPHWTTGSLSTH